MSLVLWTSGVSAAPVFERPPSPDESPTRIRCAVAVMDLDDISDARQNFTANVGARFVWNDPREAHGGEGTIVKSLDEVWHPRLFFLNMQTASSSIGGDVEISPNGTVVLRQQFWGDFSQPMALRDFPFDTQEFKLHIVAVGPERFGEIELIQDPDVPSYFVDEYSVANWEVVGTDTNSDPLTLAAGNMTEAFTFVFAARRLSTHFVVKIIAPLLMIVSLSWVVFWLDPEQGASQLAVAMTSVLTVIAYHISLSSQLPEISYLTRFDVFVFGSTLLVCLATIEVVVTTGLAQRDRILDARRLDKLCRLVFPAALLLVGTYAFLIH